MESSESCLLCCGGVEVKFNEIEELCSVQPRLSTVRAVTSLNHIVKRNQWIQSSAPSVFFVRNPLPGEFSVQSQHQRIRCHPQGLCSGMDVCQNRGLEPDFSSERTAVSLLTAVTPAALVSQPTQGGKRIPDPGARDNSKYDMGTSQLSGSPTLNTAGQTNQGIPTSNLGASAVWTELPLIRSVSSCPLDDTGIPPTLESGKLRSRVICLDSDWQTLCVLRSCEGKRSFHVAKQTWGSSVTSRNRSGETWSL